MTILIYFLSILTANILTARFEPIFIGNLIFPLGSFFIGINFVARDFVQLKYGRKVSYITIFIAICLSAICSYFLKDSLSIAFASAITFLVSESADTEVFSRYRSSVIKRVWLSGIVGLLLDSFIFIVIGLSPLFSNIISWQQVSWAIASQCLIKFISLVVCCVLLKSALFKSYHMKKAM